MSKIIALEQLKICVSAAKEFAVNLVAALSDNVLTKTNTASYTPTNDYHPATKKYVDDNAGSAGEHLSETVASETGAHDLRLYNGVLQYNDNGTWKPLHISDLLI